MEWLGLGLALIFALTIVIFLTRGVFARDLTTALKRVNQQEQALQQKADILEQRLGQMERDYQAKVKRADAEAERILEDAKSQAMNIRTAAIEEAKHRARQLLLEAEQGRAQLKVEAAKDFNGQAVQRACESLRTLLPADTLASLHEALMVELLSTVTQLEAGSLRADVAHIDIITAQPLAPAHSQRFAQWAVASLGASVPLHFETNQALVAGGLVRLGPTIIDNSLAGRLSQRG